MWERFELFWIAFEKFALFFSFLGTLTGLVVVALIYQEMSQPQVVVAPTPTPIPQPTPPIDPILDIVMDSLEKIQAAGTSVTVPVSYTVPIVLEVRIDPETARLEFVGKNRIRADDIAIKFSDDVGWLSGDEAMITFAEGEAIKVRMSVHDQIEFDVPIRHEVRIPISSGVDLEQELRALESISATWSGGSPVVLPANEKAP